MRRKEGFKDVLQRYADTLYSSILFVAQPEMYCQILLAPCRYKGIVVLTAVPVWLSLTPTPHEQLRQECLKIATLVYIGIRLGLPGQRLCLGSCLGFLDEIKFMPSLYTTLTNPCYACKQVVLIGLVYLVMPRSEILQKVPNPDKSDTISDQAENMRNKIPQGQGHDAYVVIFDAGSTGISNHISTQNTQEG